MSALIAAISAEMAARFDIHASLAVIGTIARERREHEFDYVSESDTRPHAGSVMLRTVLRATRRGVLLGLPELMIATARIAAAENDELATRAESRSWCACELLPRGTRRFGRCKRCDSDIPF